MPSGKRQGQNKQRQSAQSQDQAQQPNGRPKTPEPQQIPTTPATNWTLPIGDNKPLNSRERVEIWRDRTRGLALPGWEGGVSCFDWEKALELIEEIMSEYTKVAEKSAEVANNGSTALITELQAKVEGQAATIKEQEYRLELCRQDAVDALSHKRELEDRMEAAAERWFKKEDELKEELAEATLAFRALAEKNAWKDAKIAGFQKEVAECKAVMRAMTSHEWSQEITRISNRRLEQIKELRLSLAQVKEEKEKLEERMAGMVEKTGGDEMEVNTPPPPQEVLSPSTIFSWGIAPVKVRLPPPPPPKKTYAQVATQTEVRTTKNPSATVQP